MTGQTPRAGQGPSIPPPLPTPPRAKISLSRSIYWYCDSLRRYVSNEKSDEVKPPLADRARWLARGYHGYSLGVYSLTEENWQEYLSDFGRYQLIRLNGRTPAVLNNKLLFERAFSKYVDIPALVALIRGGIACSLVSEFGIGRPLSLNEMLDRYPQGLVIKPTSGGGGFGVHMVTRNAETILLNGKAVTAANCERMIARLDSTLIVARVQQHELSESFFPGSANSIRVMTMVDWDTQRSFVAGAVWRFGVKRSIPVDNWSSGGISVEIDTDSGVLGEAAAFSPGGAPYLSRMDRHPETGVIFTGKKVPGWTEILGRIRHTADLFPMFPVLGWDIVVTAAGFEVLEINSAPGIHIHQIHRPLMRDPDVRRFIQQSGIWLSPLGRTV